MIYVLISLSAWGALATVLAVFWSRTLRDERNRWAADRAYLKGQVLRADRTMNTALAQLHMKQINKPHNMRAWQ